MSVAIEPPIEAPVEAIVIGASAGAIEALSVILPALPGQYRLPIMIVVHMPSTRPSILAELFNEKCELRVIEAEDKEPVQGGAVYFAPPGYHLLVEMDQTLSLSNDHPVLYSRPSIDVLFESAADVYGAGLLGIILTGANQDGAAGLRAVLDCGGRGIIQTPDTAFAAAMPEAAMGLCPAALVMPVADIVHYLRGIDPL